ncbi:hypothetical protein MLD38_010043 [Melastoma candidum]|uniref:Uncharacterized protein n=1 Tax=Melastoma candidum TaxID=119954 RepID=A0ACB9QZN3_9MYRT|nr:hypothetical protein MLD38_010043 [Melastoma candidum]
MISNISFTYRSIYSKKAMTDMDSTNVYAYISIIALIVCIPPAIIVEGPQLLKYGFNDAIAKVGLNKFLSDLFWVGMFYHLYNQLATNTLERVAPLTHAVGNVLKRVFVIGFSIIVFGNKISTQNWDRHVHCDRWSCTLLPDQGQDGRREKATEVGLRTAAWSTGLRSGIRAQYRPFSGNGKEKRKIKKKANPIHVSLL